MADHDDHVPHPDRVQGLEHAREDRPPAHGQERFLGVVGEGGEAAGHPRGQDDRGHRAMPRAVAACR